MNPINRCGHFLSTIESFKGLVSASERYWPEELSLYRQSLESDDDKLAYRFGYKRDHWSNLEAEYPQLQRKSYLVMLMALFEDFLNQLCDDVQSNKGLQESVRDSKHSGIDSAKAYIKKNAEFDLPCEIIQWKVISDTQKIRNIIVHTAGHPTNERHEKHMKIINESGDLLQIEEYARKHLILGDKYLYMVLENMRGFIDQLCLRIGKKT